MKAPIPTELLEQIENAGDGTVQAIIQLRPAEKPDSIPTSEETKELATSVLARVTAKVGHEPTRVNVLRNIATVVVEGDAGFLRSLIQQPEVISVMPNRTCESPFIAPKGKRPA